MEHLKIVLGNPDEFDKAVHCGTPDYGDLTIITKDYGTGQGKACAVLTFHVRIAGVKTQVQTVTTMANLKMVCSALSGRYDNDGKLLPHHTSDGSENERGAD